MRKIYLTLVALAALALAATSCKTTPTSPDDFFQKVVTCTQDNTHDAAASSAVLNCLVGAVGGDYGACLAGLVTAGNWTVDEVACIVRGYATASAQKLNAGQATAQDQTVLDEANAWLKREQVKFR
jgi:hypothetical protein